MRAKGMVVALVILAAAGRAAASAARGRVPVAYVAVAGNNHVQVIDLESGRTLRKIYAGITPWRLALDPAGRQLWVQHWHSETTAVIDLGDHEVVRMLPARGPGTFDPSGERFLTFDWPGAGLRIIDARTFKLQRQQMTEVPRVYDLAADPHQSRLYVVQFDPMARGPRARYGYMLALPLPTVGTPASFRTGASPVRIRPIRQAPFVITADRENNGLTVLNALGDRRAIPTCAAPQSVLVSPDERRLVVPCWRDDGSRQSEIVSYRADFRSRPWPAIVRETSAKIDGAFVAGAFSPSGGEIYLVDRSGRRILELDAGTLAVRRQFPTGDVPLDIAVTAIPRAAAERAGREGRSRQRLKEVLTGMRAKSRSFGDVSWVEEIEATGKRIRASSKAPDSLRLDLEQGSVRLAQGGNAVSIEPGRHFWVVPRQEIVSVLYGIGNGDLDSVVRRMAGDVPGSAYLRGGIAVDVLTEVRDRDGHFRLIGATAPGERVAQLWVDARSGRPANLIESFPSFQARGHGSTEITGLVETKFYDFPQDGSPLPGRIERKAAGGALQRIRIVDVRIDSGLPDERFSLEHLGGSSGPAASGKPTVVADAPYLSSPQASHAPYTTQPPTSGPRLAMLAEWGVHRIPIPPELSVHNLEHGGVALQYNCPTPCPELVEQLEQLAGERDFVIVAPYPWMPHRLALAAWGRLEVLEKLDRDRVVAFLDANAGNGHHHAVTAAIVP